MAGYAKPHEIRRMMKTKAIVTIVSAAICTALFSGCATSLNSMQKSEMRVYQAKGIEVREKSPAAGVFLGFLPGGGSFYTRHYGLGVVNLLLWPTSIFWDTVNGYRGAEEINYYATKASLSKMMHKEIRAIEDELDAGDVSREQYLRKKRAIEAKYSSDFE